MIDPALSAVTFKPRPRLGSMFLRMEHTTHHGASSPIRPAGIHFDLRSSLASGMMASLMRYKAWADAALMESVLALPALQGTREGGYVTAIVRHFHTVDCIFKAHLLGVPHGYDSVNPSEPATLSELAPRVAAVDEWYVAYTRELDERALTEALHVRFTKGKERVLTRSDMLLHVSLHGAYHRGNVGVLLRLCGASAPPDGLPTFLATAGAR